VEEKLIGNVLSTLPIAAIAIGLDEKISFMNPTALDMLGDGLTGRHFITALRQPALVEGIEATLKDKKTRKIRYSNNNSDVESSYIVTCSYSPSTHVFLFFEDLSSLEGATKMRHDFVANVSHELKTPLTTLIGFIETLRSVAREDTAARERFLVIMENEAQRMNRLVTDLLTLSKVEATEKIRPTDTIEIKDIIDEAVAILSSKIEQSNVEIILKLPEKEAKVFGDKDLLAHIFTNLIENAIKYGGKNKKIIVSVQLKNNDPRLKAATVKCSIKDFGPGIDPTQVPRLTERFFRVDNHRSRKIGGTGLGLAIVKHIVKRHRGRLTIESTLGKGTEVSVFFRMV